MSPWWAKILIEDSGDGDVVMELVHMEVDKVTDMMVDMDENGRRWMQWIKMNNGGWRFWKSRKVEAEISSENGEQVKQGDGS